MMMHKTEHKLLIVDDDESLLGRLARVMERKGFVVTIASCIPDARDCIKAEQFTHAILDLKLEQGSGLDIVQILKDNQPDCRVVMLTGFGNIATAVSAVKAGAIDYLPKPADPDAIVAALLQKGEAMPPPPEDPMSADRVRWEHIQRVYEQCGRNVSETARRLKLHRRTLQRILAKHAPRP
jgi:two-component system response regulator RegA